MTGACRLKVIFEIEIGSMNYWHDRCMSGESKILNTEMGLMNYQHTRCMSGGSKMLTEPGFTNY